MIASEALLFEAQPFFEDAHHQLESTRHFGMLAESLEPAQAATRADYVTRHAFLLARVKQVVPGVGLGSHNLFPPKREERDDWSPVRNWTGLQVCQSWSVLLNAGHLWGTFAT